MTSTKKSNIWTQLFHVPILKVGNYSLTDWFVATSVIIAFLWGPLSVWVLGFDAAGRVPFLMLALSLVLYARNILHKSFRYPLSIYCFVAVFMFVNGYIQKGYMNYPSDGVYLMFCAALKAPAIMLLVAAAAKKDFDCTLDWLILALYAYVLLSMFGSGILHTNRYNLDINANEIALYTAILCALLLLKHHRGRLAFLPLVLFEAIPCYLIILTASRMGLAMISWLFVTSIFIGQNIRNLKSIILTILLVIIFAVGMSFVLKNTQIGGRMLSTTTQTEEEKDVGTSTILDKFGDRGLQYFYSWPYFIEKPITGIGFKNWILYNPYKLVCHSEYMVQYLENGLVAFIPYMVFFIALIRRIGRGKKLPTKKGRQSASILQMTMLAIAFSNSVLWSHDMYCIFAVYALCYAHEIPARGHERRRRLVFRKTSSGISDDHRIIPNDDAI